MTTPPAISAKMIERAAQQLYEDDMFRRQDDWSTSWEETPLWEECCQLAERMLVAALAPPAR